MLGCHLHAKQGLMWAISVWHVSLNLLSHLDNCTIFTAWVSRFFSLLFSGYWLFPKEFILRQRHICVNVFTENSGVTKVLFTGFHDFFSLSIFWPVGMKVKHKIIRFSKSLFWDTYTFAFMCKRENSGLIQNYLYRVSKRLSEIL